MKRRLFLQGCGGVALATPFLTSTLRTSRAATVAPKRLFLFYTPGGCLTTRWFPKVENGPITEADLTGTTIEGLGAYASKLLFPRGLNAVNAYGRPQMLDPHAQAMGSKLTCALLDDETRLAMSHSLDQQVAWQLNSSGVGSLYVNPGTFSGDPMTYISFSGALKPISPITDAQVIYDQLLTATGAPPTPQQNMRQSALDLVRNDLLRFQAVNMSASDQRRVTQWMDLLRQTEQNLSNVNSCNEQSAADKGITPEVLAQVSESASPDLATRMTAGGDLMMDLMALTMICDTNRSLMFSYPSFVTFNWDGISHNADIDSLNHRTGNAIVGGPCYPDVITLLDQLDRWYAGKFQRLITLLDRVIEGETSMLDNTATVWLREYSDGGASNLNNLPIVIAGSCGGYLKQGFSVLLEDEAIGPGNSEAGCNEAGDTYEVNTGTDATRGLVPLNKLYVTLMNAVGCQAPEGGPVQQFGVFDSATAEAGITDPGELTALRSL